MFTTPVREENLGYAASIYIPPGPRLGDIIIEAKGVCKAYGDKLLMKNVDFSIPQGVSTAGWLLDFTLFCESVRVHVHRYTSINVLE